MLLHAYAQRHGLHLVLDVTDDGDTPFAGFSTRPSCYPTFTLVCAPESFFVTDHAGYTISSAPTLAHALDTLTPYLEVE